MTEFLWKARTLPGKMEPSPHDIFPRSKSKPLYCGVLRQCGVTSLHQCDTRRTHSVLPTFIKSGVAYQETFSIYQSQLSGTGLGLPGHVESQDIEATATFTPNVNEEYKIGSRISLMDQI